MRSSRLFTALATGLAAAPLVAAGLTAPVGAAAGAAPLVTAAETPAPAKGVESWTTVSTGDVSLLALPTTLRTGDGVLHTVYPQELGTQRQYEHSTITPAGAVGAHHPVATPWGTLVYDPQLIPAPGGMRLVFSGLQDTNSGNFFSSGHMYNAVSDTSGATWTVPAEGLTRSSSAYASYGTAAVALADGTPLSAFVLNSALVWRAGTIPAASLAPAQIGTVPLDGSASQSACCAYQTSLARSGGNVYAAWYGNGHTPDSEGILVRQVHPAAGPLVVAPQSNRPTGSQFDSFAADSSVPLVTRPDGSVVAAYCLGTYSCEKLVLWQLGTGEIHVVPGAKGAQHVDMSVTPSGRLWVAWTRSDKVYAARTSPGGFTFGAVRSLGAPSGSSSLYKIVVDATDGFADVLVNDGDAISHLRLLPALSLKAKPKKWDGDKSQKVKLTVTDAGTPLAGAKVKGGGEKCTTNSSGVCKVTYGPHKPGKIKVKATLDGYAPAVVKLKVKP